MGRALKIINEERTMEVIEMPVEVKRSEVKALPISGVTSCATSEVYLMDCVQGLRHYPDNHFDLAVVDPPYRDENQPTKDMRRNGKMDSIEGRPTLEYWTELIRTSKHQIIWGANNFELPQWKGFIVWKKLTISEDFTMSMCEVAALSEGLSTVSKYVEMASSRNEGRSENTSNTETN